MADRPTLTLWWERKKVEAQARTQSLSLRRRLRRIESEVNGEVTRTQTAMPDGMISGNASLATRALRDEIKEKGEEAIDTYLEAADGMLDAQDLMVLRMAEAIINVDRIKPDDPIRLQLEAGVLNDEGEVSEFWAEQDFEEVEEFVRRFRAGNSG